MPDAPVPAPIAAPEKPAAPVAPPPAVVPGGNGAAPVPEKPAVSEQFAALAKKEKGLWLKAKDLADKEARIAAKEAEVKRFEELKKQAKLKPQEVLKAIGLEYADITQDILKGGPDEAAHIKQLRQEIEQWRKQSDEEKEKARQEAEAAVKQRNEQVIAEFRQSISDLIDTKKDEYDLIHLLEGQELVFKGVEDTYKETGKVPTIEEAAQGVMKFLTGKLDEILPKTKWFQEKYQPKTAPPVTGELGETIPTSTLSNDMGARTTLPAATEEDRIRRALAALEKP